MRLLKEWITHLFRREPDPDPARESIDFQEQRLIERLARLQNKTPQQVREEVQRRAEMAVRQGVLRGQR